MIDPTPPAKIDCSIHPPLSRSPARGFHGIPGRSLDLIGEKRATLIDVFPAEFACCTSCSERAAALFERALSFGFRRNPCEKSANPIVSLLLPRGISARITPFGSRWASIARRASSSPGTFPVRRSRGINREFYPDSGNFCRNRPTVLLFFCERMNSRGLVKLTIRRCLV